ncbi:MAG TPA: hypothetical protein DGR97_06670 [Gammaproteobacteria bacterium]|nr:hypothetical protein [Gammaproteobacteria bacterium]
MYKIALGICLLIVTGSAFAIDETAERHIDCSAYFFMAANVKSMAEFSAYYAGGEYGYNIGVRAVGETRALERFNRTSNSIGKLIGRNWLQFGKADEKYGVICADIFRAANRPG